MYDYTDYKAYLKSRIERGSQRLLAEHIGCQPAFLSQVLRGKPHLSLEQGLLASEYFQMSAAEQEYFILALQLGRAGTSKLSFYFASKMNALRRQQERVDSKIGGFEELNESTKAVYYSSWKYPLVLVLLSLPAPNQTSLLRVNTGLSDHELKKILAFLKSTGLAERRAGRWRPVNRRIHLGPEDPLIIPHHRNFRTLANSRLEEMKPDSLHYSSVMALSKTDAARVKNLLLETLSRTESLLRPSPEETARVFCIDYFEP